jgi:hypothetical protein
MAGDISDYARRNPLVFLGGAALVGFALTRFAKATSEPAGYTTSSNSMSGTTSRPGYGAATRGGTSTSPATGKMAPDYDNSTSSTGFEAPRPVGTPASPLASPAVSTPRTGEL